MAVKSKIVQVLTAGLLVFFLPVSSYAVPPQPYAIGGTVTVNGVPLTQAQAAADNYTFEVTPFTDLNGLTGTCTGLLAGDVYKINVPTYDASEQPNGGQSGQTGYIHVYKNGTPVSVTSPAGGAFTVGGAGGTDFTINLVVIINTPPTAEAGTNQTVLETVATVTLDGSGSSDPDAGDAITYHWIRTGGPAVTLLNANSVSPAFVPPNVGPAGAVLTFRLTVTDSHGASDTDTCQVTVTWVDAPPTANAGPDQTVGEGGVTVTLNGRGSSDDAGITAYHWVQTGGTPVSLSNANGANPTFTAPAEAPATLTFELTVTDTGAHTDTDTCTVTVAKTPPVADAGYNQEVLVGAQVTLDAKGSYDPNGTIVAYQWVQTAGTGVTIADSTEEKTTFTAPSTPGSLVFELTVWDNDGQTDTDTCTITVVDGTGDFEVKGSLLLPYFPSNKNYWRGLVIVNPGASSGTIKLTLHDESGKTSTATKIVSAGNTFVDLLDNISWTGSADVAGRCFITAAMNFSDGRGLAMFGGDNTGNSLGYKVEALEETSSPTSLFFPYFPSSSSSSWWRGIALVNPGASNGTVTLTLHDTSGKTATAVIPLDAGRMFVDLVENINWTGAADVYGSCYITAVMNSAGGQGFAMFGDTRKNSCGYVVR